MFDYDESKDDVLTVCEGQIKVILTDAYDKGLKDGYDLAREQKPAEGKWIPCNERLPEAGVSVIVTSKGGYVYTSNIALGEWEYGGDVIAWMPLPEPWKGADDEAL